LDKLLTTDELLLVLNHNSLHSESEIDKAKSKSTNKYFNKHIIFWSIVSIAVLHLVFAAIPLVFKDKGLSLLGYRYAVTYQYDEETSPEYPLFIAVHKELNKDSLTTDDLIVTYGRFGTKYYSVESISNIDLEQNSIETTFDNVVSSTYYINTIDAIFYRKANQIETLYFIFGTPRGFLMLIIGNLVVFGGTYIYYINPNILNNNKKQKDLCGENEEA